MKGLSLIMAIALMAFVLAGCTDKKEDETYLTTDVTTLIFENGGGSLTFSIESNTNWTITTTTEWISVSPTSGSGNKTVTVSAADQLNVIMVEGTLAIRTDDGTKMLNLTVQIKGGIPNYPTEKDKVLTLGNFANFINFSGAAHESDSLLVISNIAWEVKGPEWIEAWDGERWRPLSLETGGIFGMGEQNIPIRTAEDFNGDEVREGTIVIAERLTGNYPVRVDARQAGKYIVLTNRIVTISDGIGMNWKCGNGVKSFYYNVSEKQNSIDNITLDDFRTNWKKGTPGSGAGWVGLKENTLYHITAISEESLNSDFKRSFTFSVMTPSSKNQPIVKLNDIILYDNIWYADAEMNEYTFAYGVMAGTENDVWVTYNQALLALYMTTKTLYNPEFITIWGSSGYIPLMYNTSTLREIHCVTWGMDSKGQVSSVIKHYVKKLSNANAAPETSLQPNEFEQMDYAPREEMEHPCHITPMQGLNGIFGLKKR